MQGKRMRGRIAAIKMAAEWSDAAKFAWMEHWITPEVIAEMSVGGRRSLLHEVDWL
jgi:hypothetical protein